MLVNETIHVSIRDKATKSQRVVSANVEQNIKGPAG